MLIWDTWCMCISIKLSVLSPSSLEYILNKILNGRAVIIMFTSIMFLQLVWNFHWILSSHDRDNTTNRSAEYRYGKPKPLKKWHSHTPISQIAKYWIFKLFQQDAHLWLGNPAKPATECIIQTSIIGTLSLHCPKIVLQVYLITMVLMLPRENRGVKICLMSSSTSLI